MLSGIAGWESTGVFARNVAMGTHSNVDDIQNSVRDKLGVPCNVEVYRKPRTEAVSGYIRVEVNDIYQVPPRSSGL